MQRFHLLSTIVLSSMLAMACSDSDDNHKTITQPEENGEQQSGNDQGNNAQGNNDQGQ